MKLTSYRQFKYIKADYTTSIEDIKRQYKRLALKLHPDMGGSNEAMAELNVEFDFCKTHNYNIHETESGGTYTDESQNTPDEVTAKYAEIIEKLIKVEGIEIEICGSFVWLGGETYSHKDEIKAIGYGFGLKVGWAKKKKMWFFAPNDWKKRGRREYKMDEIRATYGSVKVATGQRQYAALTA